MRTITQVDDMYDDAFFEEKKHVFTQMKCI